MDNFVYLLLTVLVAMCMSILLIEILTKNRNSRYNEEKRYIELDKTREYYEETLYKIQSELTENYRRWADANNLIVSAQNQKNSNLNNKEINSQILKNFGIDNLGIDEDPKSVFVLTPFLNREYDTFEIVKNTCSEVNLKCIRGDENYRDKDILSHIITYIMQSSVIIANINGRNPNVYYELGICHCIGKPVILISKNKSKNNLPFDIQSKNIIFYNDLSDLQKQLKNELLKIFIDKR